jgi:hypothetical protein
MKRKLTVLIVVVVCATSAGCGVILGSAGGKLPASGGSAYSLPKAVLDVKLTDSKGNLILTIGEPEYIPDEHHTYFLEYRPNAFASDTVELTIDPKTNLLQTVNATAEDKTSQVIVELAKAAAKVAMIAQAAVEPGGEVVIFERKIDPANDTAVAALVHDMNTFAKGHAVRMYEKNKCSPKPEKEKEDECASYAILQQNTKISFTVHKPAPLKAEPADCSAGVCYRVPAPYGIEFMFNDQYTYGTIVNLPNDRPAVVLPLNRTAFVKRVNNADFEHGMLKKAHFEKPSEALEIASLPDTVITAIFSSISTLIQAKIDLSDKEKGLAQSQTALLQAQKDLQEKRVAVAQAAAQSQTSILLSGSSSGQRLAPKLSGINQQPSLNSQAGPGNQVNPSNPGELSPGTKH